MGNRLSPITHKVTEVGTSKNGKLAYAACGMQGRRSQMEDAHLAVPDLFHDHHDHRLDGHALFAVFDGHGGSTAAKFAARNLMKILLEHKSIPNYINLMLNPTEQLGTTDKAQQAAGALKSAKKALLREILEDTFIEIDRQFLVAQMTAQKAAMDASEGSKSPGKFKDPGTTALVTLVTPDLVVCANAGDCRALMIQDENVFPSPLTTKNSIKAPPRKSSSFVELSEDHKPSDAKEESRIKKAGGYVFGGRLEDDLAVSRGFGDFRYKEEHVTLHGTCEKNKRTPKDQKVSPHPQIKFLPRKSKHKFLFLGCDGVFEQMKNDKVVRVVCHSLGHHGNDLEAACAQLLDKSLRRGSKDNMTSILVDLYKTEATTKIDYSESQDSTEIFDKENEKISGQNYLEQQLLQP